MQNAKRKNYLHLHILVFIAGFTAVLGKLITIEAISLVWFRMVIASVLMFVYVKIKGVDLSVSKKYLFKLSLAGIVIALHWITFFASIKLSNASIALAMFSTGAFFASIIEPIIYKRKLIPYEILFGVIVIIGIYLIVRSELDYVLGMLLGVLSAFLSSLFAVLNGKFLEKHSATKISFYEFLSGVLFITLILCFFKDDLSLAFFNIGLENYCYLFILASICTAYAFIASVYVMKWITPFTVVLTYNLEPVYGICLALIFFPETETMSSTFYLGAALILITVLLNAIFKGKRKNIG
ncbi:DMT family transporter [Aurantibacter sp.]|uniref:DMT family transporter n=1 Tax=Aurantibacter sp. TaxID=2807103 RepID=UPI0035C7BF9E